MRGLFTLAAIVTLGACSDLVQTPDTYSCPNGPELVVSYSDAGAQIQYDNGRTVLIPPAGDDAPDVYAKPGFVWEVTGFRSARLSDDTNSYHCDKLSG